MLAFARKLRTCSIGSTASILVKTCACPPPPPPGGPSSPPPSLSCANAGTATKRAANKTIQCFISDTRLEVEAEPELDRSWVTRAVGSSEERRRQHTAVLTELLMIQKVLNIDYEGHR